MGGQKIEVEGLIKRRERDQNLSKVLLVCEHRGIMERMLNYISTAATPDYNGNYTSVTKFYLIDKSPFKTMREMFLNGECIYPRYTTRTRDYMRLPFLDVISGEK
jgi:hypothetical protein